MTRSQIKALARESLGNKIFGSTWMWGVLICLIFTVICAVCSAIPAIGTAAILVLTGPLSYGLYKCFIRQNRTGDGLGFSNLFSGFTDDFGGNFLLGLLIVVFTFLWSLLFVIPGIIKTYSYSMAFFIKIDHPEMGWKECIDGSKAMMKGHKWELFVQDLSFLGWFILGSLILGIGTLWVMPYFYSARAHFYDSICGTVAENSEA